MALLDLADVTQTIKTLLEQTVPNYNVWPDSTTLTVSPEPPHELGGDNTIGLYLYHIEEEPHFKNMPTPGMDNAPVQLTPMGINLYYQLTPHSDLSGANGIYRQQLIMGCALKAMHDYPIIDDSTTVGTTTIMEGAIRGDHNKIRISLQPISHERAVHFWTAGSAELRLAAYYQVYVVLLEPEKPKRAASRVLKYGVHTFLKGAPRLLGSANSYTYTPPGSTDAQNLEMSPAQSPPSPLVPAPALPESEITFSGVDLNGDSTELLIQSNQMTTPLTADTTWNLIASDTSLHVTIRQQTGGDHVLPGMYSAWVRVSELRTMPDGSSRTFTKTSNKIPFVIPPRIDSATMLPGNILEIQGYLFDHASLSEDAIYVFVGESGLKADTDGSITSGEFDVISPNTIRCNPVWTTPSGEWIQIRVIVNGAESLPLWIATP